MQQQPYTTDAAHAALADDVTAYLLSAARNTRRASRIRRVVIVGIIVATLALIVLVYRTGAARAQPYAPSTGQCCPPTHAAKLSQAASPSPAASVMAKAEPRAACGDGPWCCAA